MFFLFSIFALSKLNFEQIGKLERPPKFKYSLFGHGLAYANSKNRLGVTASYYTGDEQKLKNGQIGAFYVYDYDPAQSKYVLKQSFAGGETVTTTVGNINCQVKIMGLGGDISITNDGKRIFVGASASDVTYTINDKTTTITGAGATLIYEEMENPTNDEIFKLKKVLVPYKVDELDSLQDGNFGKNVRVYGEGSNRVAVSAVDKSIVEGTEDNPGRVYIFDEDENGDWNSVADLSYIDKSHTGGEYDYKFGSDLVFVDANTLVVAVDSTNVNLIGAQIYKRNGEGKWDVDPTAATLKPSGDTSQYKKNGEHVSMPRNNQNRLLLTASGKQYVGGTIYVLDRESPSVDFSGEASQEVVLPEGHHLYGAAFVKENMIINYDPLFSASKDAQNSGCVAIYILNEDGKYVLDQTLQPKDQADNKLYKMFGSAFATNIADNEYGFDTLFIGAHSKEGPGESAGSDDPDVYIFRLKVDEEEDDGPNVGLIVGCTIAAVVVVGVVIGVVIYFVKKNKKDTVPA